MLHPSASRGSVVESGLIEERLSFGFRSEALVKLGQSGPLWHIGSLRQARRDWEMEKSNSFPSCFCVSGIVIEG